jgi:high-affinity iron transporter
MRNGECATCGPASAAGIGLALALAAVMLGVARLLSEQGLEYFQLGMMLVASGAHRADGVLDAPTWPHAAPRPRGRHGEQRGERELVGLAVVVALAVGRESAETVVFPLRAGAQYTSVWDFLQVLVLGIGAAWLTFWALQQGSRFFSWRTFFRVSEILLLLLAGALLVSAVEKMIALELLPPLIDPMWDTSALIDDSSRAGGLPRGIHRLSRATCAAAYRAACRLLGVGRAAAAARVAAETGAVIDGRAAVAAAARSPAGADGSRLAAFGEWLRRHSRAVQALAVDDRRRLRVLRGRPGVPAFAGGRRALVQQSRALFAVAVLGPLVAVRHRVDVRCRAGVVRPLLP